MSVLRRFRQWVAGDPEMAAIARDQERVLDVMAKIAHQVEGIELRFERLRNKTQMRLSRNEQRSGLSPEDQAILDDIKRGRVAVVEPDDDFR